MLHHRESTELQYKLVERAADLGWPTERVEVIDDDQGISGRTIEGRVGFQRLLAEISQDRIGLVLGIEMSRLARSCKDWYYLLELCALFGTLLADQDGLYDPSNRLVAGNLEKQWEAALQKLQEVETAYANFVEQQPQALTAAQKKDIQSLAQEIPELWNADTTQPIERQEIVRLLIEAVDVDIQGHSERLELTIHWTGGFASRHTGTRKIHRFEQLYDFDRLNERARELRSQRYSCRRIAEILNTEGFRSPLQGERMSAHSVRALLRNDDRFTMPMRRESFSQCLDEGERWLQDLATELKMPYGCLHAWIRRGWIVSRQIAEAGRMHAVKVNPQEMARLRKLREHRHQSPYEKPPLSLTTPLVCGR